MKALFSRTTAIILLIVIQVIWFAVFFWKLTRYSVWISGAFTVLSVIMLLAVLVSNQNPSYKIGWLTIIGVVPLLGGLLYLLLGNNRPTKRFHNRILQATIPLRSHLDKQPDEGLADTPKRIQTMSHYLTHQAGYPPQANTEVTYYPLGEEMFAAMMADLHAAKEFIFFEYFIVDAGVMWDEMRAVLVEKAQAGLDVRVMYDEFGCLGLLPKNFVKDLTGSGVQVVTFNPLVPFLSWAMNNRDHRKILVIDGQVGYNGGINIADEYINAISPYGHWKDTGLRLVGDGVANLTTMFLEVWNSYRPPVDDDSRFFPPVAMNSGTGFVQPFSDTPFDDEPVAENLYIDILSQAQDYVYIFTPYLIITNEMQTALTMAAKRGVDVRVVVPGIADQKMVYRVTKSFFRPLIAAGVKVYTYTPGYLHAKSYVSDDRVAVVGTINMDYRSLYLHFECGTFLVDVPAIADLKDDCLATMAKSQLQTLDDCQSGPWNALVTALLRVVAPLL